MEKQGKLFIDYTDFKIERDPDSDFYPHNNPIQDYDFPEIKFDLESFSMESIFESIGVKPEEDALTESFSVAPRSLEVRIKGKRIWWKPWKRRPDKVYYFPKVDISFIDEETARFRISS